MKGVVLAGGRGSRLLPATRAMNKHMIPILNRPMIEYPLETIRTVFGVDDILIVSGGEHLGAFADYLGDGSAHSISLTYRVQKEANGIAGALSLARSFVGNDTCVVILGDNVFGNNALIAAQAGMLVAPAVVLAPLQDPRRFGVPVMHEERIVDVVEKPPRAPSPYAVTGLYLYTPDVFSRVELLQLSARGELEISDINASYAKEGVLAHCVTKGFWSDAGTPDALARTAAWVHSQPTLEN